MKIPYDKYYTSETLAKRVVETAISAFGLENITEFVEPSAGAGVFLPFLKETGKPVLAYDILPEGDGIETADFLTLDLPYKKGRCVIGNPPFFYKNKIGLAFYKKACVVGDYVVFILPNSVYKGSPEYCAFDLVSSELVTDDFGGKSIPCCLNVYQRPKSGQLRKKRLKHGNDLVSFRQYVRSNERVDVIPSGYVLSFCNFGVVGTPSQRVGQYASEIYVYCSDKTLAERIRSISTKENLLPYARQFSVSTPKLSVSRYWDYLRENIPELNDEPPTLDDVFD